MTKTLNSNFRLLCLYKNISAVELAIEVGVPHQVIENWWLHDKGNMDEKHIIKIKKVLNVDSLDISEKEKVIIYEELLSREFSKNVKLTLE